MTVQVEVQLSDFKSVLSSWLYVGTVDRNCVISLRLAALSRWWILFMFSEITMEGM